MPSLHHISYAAKRYVREAALRFADEHTSRVERIEGLVSGMIAAHSVYPSLHRVLLEDVRVGRFRNLFTRSLRVNIQISTLS
jgi:hypothetical protein